MPPRARPETALTDDQAELAGRYYKLAVKMANDWTADSTGQFDDFYDAAVDGLLGACRDFKPAVLDFPGHLIKLAVWRKLANKAARLRFKARVMPRAPFHKVEDLGWPDRPFGEALDFEFLIADLPDEAREYILLRFRNDHSRLSAARTMGIGSGKARGIETRAFDALRGSVPTGMT